MYFNLFDALFITVKSFAEFLRTRKNSRLFILLTSTISLIVFSTFLLISIFSNSTANSSFPIFMILTLISLFLFLSSVLAFSETEIVVENSLARELLNLSQERVKIKEKIIEKPLHNNAFNTIQLNLNQTTEYYTINKSQAKSSFGASVFAMFAGLVTILVGIWLFYFKDDPNLEVAIITVSSGVLFEIIGGLYFHVYNKSISQLNFFYEKLEKMQDTMLSIELSNSIEDQTKKIELQEKIILNLIQRNNILSNENS